MTAGPLIALLALALATAAGLVYRARNGRVRESRARYGRASDGRARDGAGARGAVPARLTELEIGGPLGSRATLLQFSSAFCAPCRATRAILADVARATEGVAHIEVDAESRLDLVRRLDVRRTPTTFVLSPAGEITHKASGQPRTAEMLAVLAARPASANSEVS